MLCAASEDPVARVCGWTSEYLLLPAELGVALEDFIKPLPSWHLCRDRFSSP